MVYMLDDSVVLLSGLLSDEWVWRHQVACLGKAALVINSYDNTPEKMIKAILARAPERFALVGHSMGGWLALEVMRHAPERVTRLALVNTTSASDSQEKRDRRLAMIEEVKKGHFEQVIDRLMDFFVYNPAVKAEVRQMFMRVGPKAFIAQEEAMLMRDESVSLLSKIACPTVVIYAEHDAIFSREEHQFLVDTIPGATLVSVAGSGHMSPLEQPDAINSILLNHNF